MVHEHARWNENTIYALGFYKRLIRLLGLWPLDDESVFSTLRVITAVAVLMTLAIIFASHWIVTGSCGSITDLVDAVSLMTMSLMSVMKIILPWVHRRQVASIVIAAVQDWRQLEDTTSRAIMIKHAYIGRIVFIVQMLGAYMTIIPLILMRLPNVGPVDDAAGSLLLRNIPIGPRCWVPLGISLFTYLAYYAFVCVHLFILTTTYLGIDVFAFGLAMHLCGQFELLYRSFEELDGNDSPSRQRAKVSKFSKRHNALLTLANDFETVFHIVILFELGANTFIISISGNRKFGIIHINFPYNSLGISSMTPFIYSQKLF